MKLAILFTILLSPFFIYAQETGLEEINDFRLLPVLRNDVINLQNSSHDRAGGNANDGFNDPNSNNPIYFYGDYNSEKVLLHSKGKGIVNRIWATGWDLNQHIKVYFDGQTSPAIDEKVSDFFSGLNSPYLSPFMEDGDVSSGGLISYMPFPFEEEVIITTNIGSFPNAHGFFNVGYIQFDNNAIVNTWDGSEDLTRASDVLTNKGQNPNDNPNYKKSQNSVDLASGETKSVLKITEPNQSVGELFLEIPALSFSGSGNDKVTDKGRAHKGYSQFVLTVDPGATQVTLRRRFDFGIADQKADVYVDNVLAGEWSTLCSDGASRWRDSDFLIPAELTSGKSSITVKVVFKSSAIDWNEFYYWVICDGTVTDELDVNNTASESDHSYVIDTQTWAGEASFIYGTSIGDDGRANTGYSQFTMKVKPGASEYKLVRRLNYGIANQKARVYVDGVDAGIWFDEGASSVGDAWMNSEFIIPSNLVGTKTSVVVKIEFISSAIDWNEFRYWMYCDGGLTDEFDVRNTESESLHSYTSTGGWQGCVQFDYIDTAVDDPLADILKDVQIQIFYDGETTPSIDAPIGLFFGVGTMQRNAFQSLPVGITDGTNQMYCYFPMPFKNSYEVKLVNNYSEELTGVNASISYSTVAGNINSMGYLKTQYNRNNPPSAGADYTFLDVTGLGKYVGVVLEVNNSVNDFWLEGDERFYLDGSRTPSLYGTGTEDYFNGAWYFANGPFNLFQHGFTSFKDSDRTLYRFHLTDPVYFSKSAKLGIEHGPANDEYADYSSLAFYYIQDTENMTLTDELNIGDATSETAHSYVITGSKQEQINKSYYFEGDSDNISVTESGNYIDGSSEFIVNVTPGKKVKIKRLFDYNLESQWAEVYVDNQYVGIWFTNGSNDIKRWREEFFIIPEEFTAKKSQIKIEFRGTSGEYKWSEFHYWIYSMDLLTDYNDPTAIAKNNSDLIKVFPNPAKNRVYIDSPEPVSVELLSLNGVIIRRADNVDCIEVSDLKKGVYILKIISGSTTTSKKIVKQ